MFDTRIHCERTPPLSDEHIHYLICSPFFFYYENNISSTLLGNVNYIIVLSTIVTMLYIKSPDLIRVVTESVPLYQPLPISVATQARGNHHSSLCESDVFFLGCI